MTQNKVDTDFVDGLQLIIDSLIKEGSEQQEPFNKNFSDEESNDIEKIIPLAAIPAAVGAGLGAVGRAAAGAVGTGLRAAGKVASEVAPAVVEGVSTLAEDMATTGAEAAQEMSDTDEKGARFVKNINENDLPEADHWCPDVMDWHTSDHESAKAPSVHINVDNHSGDDP